MIRVESFAGGQWIAPGSGARSIADASTGAIIAEAGDGALDFAAMVAFAKERGGPALRAMTFHDRARMLKAMAGVLTEHKEALYDLSYATGATLRDHAYDIDGGIGTLFVYSSKGRRELPDRQVLTDGAVEPLGKMGQFVGQHIYQPLHGVAVHINAFNFPVWGMLEKIAPALLAGMPSIVKPATVTSYVTEACVRILIDSGVLPEGALQLIAGEVGDLFDHLGGQDIVTFTGSAATGAKLRAHPGLIANAVRFTAEQDSLNATILGPDVQPGGEDFDVFVKEIVREMTTKAGQKCTAIRRILVPEDAVLPVLHAISAKLETVRLGDPRAEGVTMGPLVSLAQRQDVESRTVAFAKEAEEVLRFQQSSIIGGDRETGAFFAPALFHCAAPAEAQVLHQQEAFGPVATVMPYGTLSLAADLANRGQGSLVASCVTQDGDVARELVALSASHHGRLYFSNASCAAEATGHGVPMPHLTHGGPGRAGGGEELGGIRAVTHYMQRTAVQGSPALVSAITGTHLPGAPTSTEDRHPFRHRFGELFVGQSLLTAEREISLEDIEHFAAFTGDTFYAHMDEAAAARNPFFPGRVAHGYLLISFAAGLFVDPEEGPVLANTGLDNLRFTRPVVPGERLSARLTVIDKTPRRPEYGEVRWRVELLVGGKETAATYELLTMVAL